MVAVVKLKTPSHAIALTVVTAASVRTDTRSSSRWLRDLRGLCLSHGQRTAHPQSVLVRSHQRAKSHKLLDILTRGARCWVAAWGCLALWPAAALGQSPDFFSTYSRFSELYAQDRYDQALHFGEKALGELGRSDHPLAASLLSKLASLYHAFGRYDEAGPLYEQLLAILTAELGPEHPRVIFGLNNLAAFYLEQGKYAKAEPVYAKALEALEKVLGPEHPQVTQGLNTLAGIYKEQRKYAEAEPLFERAMAVRERTLGPTHRSVGESLNNLAGLYRDQGRYVEAEPLYVRSLAIQEHALGSDHPLVALTLDNYAVLLRATQRHTEATNAEAHADALRASWVRRTQGHEI